MRLRPRSALLAISVLLAFVVAAATAPTGATAEESEDVAPLEVIVELRVWQHVGGAPNIWVSARPRGGDWRTLGTIHFPLDDGFAWGDNYRYGDLAVAGAALRIWQQVGEPERISVCAYLCPDPSEQTIPHPVGAILLPLDDGHSPSGQHRYGDLTVTTFPGSPELLGDRVQLLRLRDTLAGTGTLDWDGDTPMATWSGVSIGGTPQRVTKLQLANRGLDGELSGLLGNLTGLKELRLGGNALTGTIPSKFSRLTRLTHAYLGGNALTHCVPPLLRTVANNDIASLGLPDCLPPIAAINHRQILTEGSYVFFWSGAVLIFDVPVGAEVAEGRILLTRSRAGYPPRGAALTLEHAGGRSEIGLSVLSGAEWTSEGNRRRVDRNATGVSELFDRIVESAWTGAPGTAYTLPPKLDVGAFLGGGELELEWTISRAGATRWQYRQKGPGAGAFDAAWGAWTDIPDSDGSTTNHRLTGLQPGVYNFQVRAWMAHGPGVPHDPLSVSLSRPY